MLLIAAAFAIPFFEPETWSGVIGPQLGGFIFLGFVFLGSATVSFLYGCMRVIFSQNRNLPRPYLRAPILFGCSPLQFPWFTGLLSISVGLGSVVRHFDHGFSFEGVLLIAAGIGLVSGSVLTLKIKASRFVSHGKNRTAEI